MGSMRIGGVIGLAWLVSAGSGWAEMGHDHGGHDHGAHDHGVVAPQAATGPAEEQILTGEVVDVFCYLSHPAQGLGAGHASCAKKCIKGGLPVAIRADGHLYLATMADHSSANQRLGDLAGEQVTVRGKVMELEGQRLIAVSEITTAH